MNIDKTTVMAEYLGSFTKDYTHLEEVHVVLDTPSTHSIAEEVDGNPDVEHLEEEMDSGKNVLG